MPAEQRILIFQIGSLGDTVIAMPCYREIARRHRQARRYLLTNYPAGAKMVQAAALLAPCGLIHESIEYPMPLRGFGNVLRLYSRLRALRIDLLYYLTPEKHLANLARHFAFFKASGVRKLLAVPWSRDLRFPRPMPDSDLWESEASRLLRAVGAKTDPGPPPSSDRALDLSAEERSAAGSLLAEAPEMDRFLVVSVGGKVPINDWGNRNWGSLLRQISSAHPRLGAVFVGSADERERNRQLANAWFGPSLNACGRLKPRETAALIERAEIFLGHDTGALHLAAATGARIIGIYSARNLPGKWFSDREGDRFFYRRMPCFGCELTDAADCPHAIACMAEHRVDEIAAAATAALTQE